MNKLKINYQMNKLEKLKESKEQRKLKNKN